MEKLNITNECNPIEEYTVYSSDNLEVVTSPTFDDNLYNIKIYKYKNNNKIGVTRISMKTPEYLDTEFNTFILTKDDLNEFISCLYEKRIKEADTSVYTVWDMLIDKSNDCYKRSGSTKLIPENLQIPDYTLLETLD